MMPPTTAPGTESRPPRMMAGKASKAVSPSVGSTVNVLMARKRPPMVAMAAAMPHASAFTVRMSMPSANAASWSRAVARIASPYFVKRKKTKSAALMPTVAAIVHRSGAPKCTPPVSKPEVVAKGDPGGRKSEPKITCTPVCNNTFSPIVIIRMAKTGLPIMRRKMKRSNSTAIVAVTTIATANATKKLRCH